MKRVFWLGIIMGTVCGGSQGAWAGADCLASAERLKARVETILQHGPSESVTNDGPALGGACGLTGPYHQVAIYRMAGGRQRLAGKAVVSAAINGGTDYWTLGWGAAFCDDGRVFYWERSGERIQCR